MGTGNMRTEYGSAIYTSQGRPYCVAMQYFESSELRRLFQVAYDRNRNHHLFLITVLWHGLRVSEGIGINGVHIADAQLSVKRLKKSKATVQPIHIDDDPLLDCSPLIQMAANNPGRLFNFSRQRADQFIKRYAALAGIHPDKAHMHSLKHSMAMLLWDKTHALGPIQSWLGHREAASTMQYLVEVDNRKAQAAAAGISL